MNLLATLALTGNQIPEHSRIRHDIQALRAVAVSVVILFHIWPSAVPGGYVGVDVFFVISGYLITNHLAQEISSTGKIQLCRFWANRCRRLLPAAFLVLAATSVLLFVYVPPSEWTQNISTIIASAAYIANWHLALNAVDYFASEASPSATQHYWSLSTEEQFYFAWPIILSALAWLSRKFHRSILTMLRTAIATVFLVSLGWSIWSTGANPEFAYFSTLTHAWEFALGGMLVLLPPIPMVSAARVTAVIAGFSAIIASSLMLSEETLFPGWIALVPAIGAFIVIAAGGLDFRLPLMSARPLQRLGDISYSAYLWHWPLVVIAPFALGSELSTATRIAVLVLTLIVASLSKKYVEDTFRFSARWKSIRPHKTISFAAIGSVVIIVFSAAVQNTLGPMLIPSDFEMRVVAGLERCFGALAARPGITCPNSHTLNLSSLEIKIDGHLRDKPTRNIGGTLDVMEFGEATSDVTIALVGDSHAHHYLPALIGLARKHRWRIWSIRQTDCSPSTATWQSPYPGDMTSRCQAWRNDLYSLLPKNSDIDVIITSSVSPRIAWIEDKGVHSAAEKAIRDMWRAWSDSGKQIIAIADVPGPRPKEELGTCVMKNRHLEDPCALPRADVVDKDLMIDAARNSDVVLLDFTDTYCSRTICHAVVGGLNVYGGGAHISPVFALSLAKLLEPSILQALMRRGG